MPFARAAVWKAGPSTSGCRRSASTAPRAPPTVFTAEAQIARRCSSVAGSSAWSPGSTGHAPRRRRRPRSPRGARRRAAAHDRAAAPAGRDVARDDAVGASAKAAGGREAGALAQAGERRQVQPGLEPFDGEPRTSALGPAPRTASVGSGGCAQAGGGGFSDRAAIPPRRKTTASSTTASGSSGSRASSSW